MTKIVYPQRMRAVRVREDMVLITTKNAPAGAWKDILLCGDKGLLLGNPQNGWLRLAVSASSVKEIFFGEIDVITAPKALHGYIHANSVNIDTIAEKKRFGIFGRR